MIDRIQWLDHSSFVIEGTPTVYINPRNVPADARNADVILVGHNGYRYCSTGAVARLRGPHTQVIGGALAASEIPDCTVLRPWQSITVGRACVQAVPAYDPTDGPQAAENGSLGFVISVNHYDIYYAGHTRLISEMQRIRADVAIVPIDGEGTLNPSEAAAVVAQIRPRWVIPMNWGVRTGAASRIEAQRFASEVGTLAEVVLLPTPN
ncbi:MAG: hypothetical protein GYB67_15610 [Chloroflexi bacterium]|nr:hypothetical protein [Chloroflexota bacterium]